MYASRFGKRKANRAKRPVKRVPRKRSGGRKAITQIVKSVLSRQAETKHVFDYGSNQSISVASTTVPVYRSLIPPLNQGVGSSQRVGNEVRFKSGYIKGRVNIMPYNAGTNSGPTPTFVKMWIISSKVLNTNNLGGTTIGISFFDINNSTVGLQGNVLDLDLPVNRDLFTVHATKTVKIGAGYTSSVGTPVASTTNYFDNSSMSMPFSFNIGKYIGLCKYDDTTNVCSNKNLFIVFQACSADGSTYAGQIPAEFHYSTKVSYTDL